MMEPIYIHHTILKPQYESNRMHPTTKENLDKWITLNPHLDLIQRIWTHDECIKFLRQFSKDYGKDILVWFNWEPDGRYKSDIVRLCFLYKFGGFYADIDQEPLVSLTEYFDPNKYDFCGCTNMGYHNISNGFIYAKEGSNIIQHR